jgi:hypothetical protein
MRVQLIDNRTFCGSPLDIVGAMRATSFAPAMDLDGYMSWVAHNVMVYRRGMLGWRAFADLTARCAAFISACASTGLLRVLIEAEDKLKMVGGSL